MGYKFIDSNRAERWHRWFAWYPVWWFHTITDDNKRIEIRCWWVWIERRWIPYFQGHWRYRTVGPKDEEGEY